jgi:hypothetical protein
MQDLFTNIQTPPPTGTPLKNGETQENPSASLVPLKVNSRKKEKSLFRVYYKGKGGKFSDMESARIVQIEKDNRIFKNNWYYWKRQAERLSADYYTEHEKVLELEEKVKVLEEKLKSLTNNLSYAEKTYPQQKAILAS